jgi:hypothetical protein
MKFAMGFRSSRGQGAGDCSDVEEISSGVFVLYSTSIARPLAQGLLSK